AQMKRLELIMEACFDQSMKVSESIEGRKLTEELVAASVVCKTKTKEASKEYLHENLTKQSKRYLKELGDTVIGTIKRQKIPTRALWQLTRSSVSNKAREAGRSALKRGSSKLLLFSEEERAALFEAAKSRRMLKIEMPAIAKDLSLVGGLQNRFVVDEDIIL